MAASVQIECIMYTYIAVYMFYVGCISFYIVLLIVIQLHPLLHSYFFLYTCRNVNSDTYGIHYFIRYFIAWNYYLFQTYSNNM